MERESSALPGPADALWSTVKSDRLVQLATSAFAVTMALYLLPVLSDAQRTLLLQSAGPVVLLSLVVLALRRDLGRLGAEERRFWNDVSAAFAAWLAGAAINLVLPPAGRALVLDLVVEACYAVYYVALVLAAERQPHRAQRWRPRGLERTLAWPAVIAFVLGLFSYFIVIPILVDPLGSGRMSSRFVLYLTLDAYLTARFLLLAGSTRVPRWRMLYLVLGVTAGAVFLNDLIGLASEGGAGGWGTLLDLTFYLPFLTIVVARARHFPFPKSAATEGGDDLPSGSFSGPSGRTMVYALVFPLAHFGCYAFGLLGDPGKAAREILIFWVLLLLALIAGVQQRLWGRKIRELWLDRRRVDEDLRKSEKDLRMMVERFHADRQLRTAEEKFAKALRVSSDVIAITSLVDGRIADVNDSFERVTGHRREDTLGKTVAEIDIWAHPEERQIMVQLMERQGFVRNMEAKFRTRDGRGLAGLFSAEKLTLDGEPYMLSVTHILSADEPAGEANDAERNEAGPASAADLTAS